MISDDNLIACILNGGKEMHHAMRQYYLESSCRTDILKLLGRYGASNTEAEDIFQDGVVAFVISVRKDTFRRDASIKTYIASICKKILYNQKKRDAAGTTLKGNISTQVDDYSTPEFIYLQKEKQSRLDELLENIGEKCRKILSLWSMRYSMVEIASEMGYKSAGMARKKKHQCLKHLIRLVQKTDEVANFFKT